MLRRCVVAALAGLLLSAAFEPVAVPVVMPLSLAAFALTTRGLRVRSGWLPGLAFGMAFYFVHISWMGASIGVGPWIALAGVESVFYGVLGSVATLLHRLRAWPAWLALAWVAMEVTRSTWPFSGMPWGRLGFGVMDSPLSPLLAYVGVNGVSLGVAFIGFLLARLVVGESTRERLLVAAGAVVTLVAMLVPAVAPYRLATTGTAQVAAVQGDVPGDGTDVASVFRQVTDNQVDATVQLADDVRAGTRPTPDLVIWPENSTAVDPFTDLVTHEAITRAVDAVGVPVLVGALVDAGPGHVLNQGIVWDPETGAGDRYTKWHPVPYGEYIPYRSLLARFSLRVDQVPKDMDSGDRQTPLRIAGVDLGDAICFDIAYDDGLTAQVEHGASMLAVQTSNASFIDTHQIEQQFAMTRARAVETGRWVVVASINGVSGVISPDGTVVARTERRTRAVLDEQVGLVTGVTPGLRVGGLLGDTAPWSVALGVLLALRAYARRRSAGRDGQRESGRVGEAVSEPTAPGPSPVAGLGRVVMVVPTYDEADNLAWIVGRLRAAQPDVDVLVVDDASPDGTGAVADTLAAADPRVHVLHREGKAGLGAAYLHGFAWALEQGYDVVGEMDADGSHQPEELHRLVEALPGADLVIGSRWVPGGSVVNWPLRREALSRGGNLYVRLLLGIAVRDATAGYRLFHRRTLEKIDLAQVQSTGYVFQTDLVTRTLGAGLVVREVPIEFVERVRGDSKMSGAVAQESLKAVTVWGVAERRRRVRAAWARRRHAS